jgi:CRP-like cAMP-binding protein
MARTATVRATRPTTLLAMDVEIFRPLVNESLTTTADLFELVRQRLERA